MMKKPLNNKGDKIVQIISFPTNAFYISEEIGTISNGARPRWSCLKLMIFLKRNIWCQNSFQGRHNSRFFEITKNYNDKKMIKIIFIM